MKYITKLGHQSLYDDTIGRVELWDFSRANESEAARTETIATVASICYGKEPRNAAKLVERLRTESGGLSSSAFEFVRSGIAPTIHGSLRNESNLKTDTEYAAEDLTLEDIQSRHIRSVATFKAKIPIFVARQLIRHRSFSFQELSRRYTKHGLEWWMPNTKELDLFGEAYDQQALVYKRLLKYGVKPEQARAVLGTGLYTELWIQGDIPALRNYFNLRTEAHTQKEHRELAEAMLRLLKANQPELYNSVKPERENDDAQVVGSRAV